MKITEEKKALALEITQKYARTAQTMAEIAAVYKKKENLAFKVTSDKVVSKCIYFCIFYGLIDSREEETVINKIAENQRRHCMHVKSSNNDFLKKKYFELLDDKKEYLKCIEILSYIENYEDLMEELERCLALRIDDYISSEDARYYNPPRDEETIRYEMEKCLKILNTTPSYLTYEKAANEEVMRIIEKKWSI